MSKSNTSTLLQYLLNTAIVVACCGFAYFTWMVPIIYTNYQTLSKQNGYEWPMFSDFANTMVSAAGYVVIERLSRLLVAPLLVSICKT